MLTSIDTRTEEDSNKTTREYYYSSSYPQHYYCQLPFNYDSNNFYHPSLYETNQYYTSLSSYSHVQDDNSNIVYPTACHSLENQRNEIFYHSRPEDSQITPYSIPFSNSMFPSSVEQVDHSDISLDGTCRSDSIIVELLNRSLWLKFAPHTLENIITRTGRRMFPILEFKVYGLKPESTYEIYIDIVPVDLHYWKFNSGKWIPSGQTDEQQHQTDHHFLHSDSPNSGAHWMKMEKISFSKLKLTNNKQLSANHRKTHMTALLNSMHKYIPRLNIIEINSCSHESSTHMFTFPETQFIAVTAYQNTDITQLKIDYNPFAKGFRDSPDHRNTHQSYSYNSSSSIQTELDYHHDKYEHLQPKKKKRLH